MSVNISSNTSTSWYQYVISILWGLKNQIYITFTKLVSGHIHTILTDVIIYAIYIVIYDSDSHELETNTPGLEKKKSFTFEVEDIIELIWDGPKRKFTTLRKLTGEK